MAKVKCRYCKQYKDKKDMQKLEFRDPFTGKTTQKDFCCKGIVGDCRKL